MRDGLTPMRAIRMTCISCIGSRKAVRGCPQGADAFLPCPLHPYRMGRNPDEDLDRQLKKRQSVIDKEAL